MTLFSSIFGIRKNKNEAIQVLDAQTFKDSISHKKVQLIDVRTSNEFKSGQIKDAKNIDFHSDKFTTAFNKLDKQKPVYIYCRSGSRSRQASKKLSAMGFKEIFDLKGGILRYN